MAEDARIRKTKEKLSAAFVELLKEQPFCEITPAKICEKAGINRSTFYRNYRNTTQLKEEIEQKIMDNVEWSGRDFDVVYSKQSIVKQLLFLQEKQDTFEALTSGHFKGSIFEKLSRKLIDGAVCNYGKFAGRVSEMEYRNDCVFYISAMVGVIFNWYRSGMQEPAEELAEFIVRKLEKSFLSL